MSQPAFARDIFEDARERSAFDDVSHSHYIKARQSAEEFLKENPNSVAANYVLAYVFWNGEGNHIRAMQLLKKTIALFESKYCDPETGIPSDSGLQVWQQRIYKDLSDVYAELDMRPEELATHQKVADLYHAELGEDAVWSLIKLDRFDEARAIAEHSINGQDTFWADKAYNDLVALEDARHGHLEAMDASIRSVNYHAGKSCVVLINHARGLALLLKLDEAIQYYLKSVGAKSRDCITSPYSGLSMIYLSDGKWQSAISALLKARKRNVEQRYKIQTEMQERSNMASILFEMGFSERAYALMQTVVNAPSRLGYDSLLKGQMEFSQYLSYFAITSDAYRRNSEALSVYRELNPLLYFGVNRWIYSLFKDKDKDIIDRIEELQKEKKNLETKLWSANQKLFKYALNEKNLMSFLVPFYVMDTPLYYYAVSDALGNRTAEFMLEYEKSILKAEEIEMMHPVFDHMTAYFAWRDGNYEKAVQFAEQVERDLPKNLSLLLQQTRLIKADAYQKTGRRDEALKLFADIYRIYPAVFRHFDIRLPIRFDDTMNAPVLKDAMEVMMSGSSPRFEYQPDAPFVISGSVFENMVQLCLSTTMGQRLACSSIDPKEYGGDSEKMPYLAEIMNNFYHQAFAPKVDMSQQDLNSLDGSPVQISADQALEKLLKTTSLTSDSFGKDDE